MLAIVVSFGCGAFPVGAAIIEALIGLVGICHAVLPPVRSLVLVGLSPVLSRSEPAGEVPKVQCRRKARPVGARVMVVGG